MEKRNNQNKGYAAHYLIGTKEGTLRNSGLTMTEDGIVNAIFTLENSNQEKPSTIFIPGCLAPFKIEESSLQADLDEQPSGDIRASLAHLAETLEKAARLRDSTIQAGDKTELYNYHIIGEKITIKKMV